MSEKFVEKEINKLTVRLMNRKEMVETVAARLDIGYEVTDFLTEPQEYFPCSYWVCYTSLHC